MGEVGHKQGLERVPNTLTNTKVPSQCVLWVLKNLQKTSRNLKNLRIPLSGAPKQGRKAFKALANKDKPRKPRARRGQQNDTRRAPPDGGALCAYRERISGTEKEGHSPTEHSVMNTSVEKNPSPSICIEKTKSALY